MRRSLCKLLYSCIGFGRGFTTALPTSLIPSLSAHLCCIHQHPSTRYISPRFNPSTRLHLFSRFSARSNPYLNQLLYLGPLYPPSQPQLYSEVLHPQANPHFLCMLAFHCTHISTISHRILFYAWVVFTSPCWTRRFSLVSCLALPSHSNSTIPQPH